MESNKVAAIPLTATDAEHGTNDRSENHPSVPPHASSEVLDFDAECPEREEGGSDTQKMRWDRKREYLLSAIGYSVGVGNLARFPYVCNRNGGGAFLIPFLLALTLIGLPLYSLDVVLGQFSGRNAVQVWSICPLLKGAGIGSVILSLVAFYYYNTLMVWTLYYFVSSFKSELPWSVCDGWWNTPNCYTFVDSKNTSSRGYNTSSTGVTSSTDANASFATDVSVFEGTGTGRNVTSTKVSSSEEFWQHNVLQLSSGLEEPGPVVWYLAVCLAVAILFSFLALLKGIRSSGKVVYVTATAPYVLITVLLVRGVTLPGAVHGVLFYITPDFQKLMEPQVWVEAALQVFYSLGATWGGPIVMASYNKFHNNCLRDSLILTLVSEGTSVYGGFAIFAVLGYMAHVSGLDIDKVVSSGPGLAFITYPEAMSLMPLPQLWAVLFFLMVITLIIDSQMTNLEVVLSAVMDMYPRVLYPRRTLVTGLFSLVVFFLSLPFVTQGGVYVFQLVDWFIAALSTMTIGIAECLVVGWVYGVVRFGDDIYLMIGRRPPLILCIFWKYITPCLLTVVMVATFVNYTPPTYGDYVYGVGGTVFGWCVALVSFIPLPAVMAHQLWTTKGTLAQRLRKSLQPDYTLWKPSDEDVALEYVNKLAPRV